jgi:SP family arabinose:H+ symporter-like MFS transporter
MIEEMTPRTSPPQSEIKPSRGSAFFLGAVCLTASIGGLLFGFDTAVISGAVGFVEKFFLLSKLEVGWFVSSALVGCILGAAVSGALSDRFGRKPILIISALCFFLCAFISAVPSNFSLLIGARILGGLGVGMASVLAPLFVSEFSPPRMRGRLVALYQLSIVIGILVAYLSNWLMLANAQAHPDCFAGVGWLHWIMVTQVWRGMFGTGMIPAAAFFTLLLFVPESPRWLIEAGKNDRALAILTRIGGQEVASREMKEIQASVNHEEGTIRELFRPGLRVALIIAIGLSVFGQLSGVNIVVYYGPEILKSAHLPLQDAFQWQVVLGIINLVFTVIAIFVIDSLGRRPLLIGGMTMVTISLGATAVLLQTGANAYWIVFLLCTYMACVALSVCAVIWVITAEIFPNRVRGRAMSIATFANWGANTLNIFIFPWFVDKYGIHAGFFVYAVICLAATVFFWALVPETKGKSLEEIESFWVVPGTARTVDPR